MLPFSASYGGGYGGGYSGYGGRYSPWDSYDELIDPDMYYDHVEQAYYCGFIGAMQYNQIMEMMHSRCGRRPRGGRGGRDMYSPWMDPRMTMMGGGGMMGPAMMGGGMDMLGGGMLGGSMLGGIPFGGPAGLGGRGRFMNRLMIGGPGY